MVRGGGGALLAISSLFLFTIYFIKSSLYFAFLRICSYFILSLSIWPKCMKWQYKKWMYSMYKSSLCWQSIAFTVFQLQLTIHIIWNGWYPRWQRDDAPVHEHSFSLWRVPALTYFLHKVRSTGEGFGFYSSWCVSQRWLINIK